MQIQVKNINHGFFYQQPITVTIKEYGVVVWCNHAEADEVELIHDFMSISGPEQWSETAMECPKCGAYQLPGESIWEDAPTEGVHNG